MRNSYGSLISDFAFIHIGKNSFAIYNSGAKSECFGLKKFDKFLDFPYTEKIAAYIQGSAKFWTWRTENFLYVQFREYFPENERFRACQRAFLDIRKKKICICPNGLQVLQFRGSSPISYTPRFPGNFLMSTVPGKFPDFQIRTSVL